MSKALPVDLDLGRNVIRNGLRVIMLCLLLKEFKAVCLFSVLYGKYIF